jgi:uncharacterized protein
MKKFLAHILFLLCAATAVAQDLPKRPEPPRLVNDFTGTLTDLQIQELENKLVAFDDTTSTQIAVVIVESVDGDDIADYNVKLGRAWGVGSKDFNNGVVLLIAKSDRKMNIATGYGVEGALPDITCKHIIEDEIVPEFKADDFYRGINRGTDAIIKAVQGEYQVRREKTNNPQTIKTILVMLLVIFLKIIRGGGRGGSYTSRSGFHRMGGPVIWGGGGHSSGGGGFGGFGGGSFGGGGASGSW